MAYAWGPCPRQPSASKVSLVTEEILTFQTVRQRSGAGDGADAVAGVGGVHAAVFRPVAAATRRPTWGWPISLARWSNGQRVAQQPPVCRRPGDARRRRFRVGLQRARRFSGAMPAESLYEALAIYADVVRRPHLAADQMEDSRLVCLQEVRALEDDLAQRLMLELRRRRYPDPYGRSSQGTEESLQRIQHEDIRRFQQSHYRPNESILGVAGKVDWDRLRDQVAQLLGDWEPDGAAPLDEQPAAGGYSHLRHASSQTHIGVAYPSVPYADPDYFQVRGAVGVSERRDEFAAVHRGARRTRPVLRRVTPPAIRCAIVAAWSAMPGRRPSGAGDVGRARSDELERLAHGVRQDELDRLKARIKSILIMQQESRCRAAVRSRPTGTFSVVSRRWTKWAGSSTA